MNGTEGVGGVAALRSLLNYSGDDRKPAGMEGALVLSRKFLSAALSEIGFVDIHGSSIQSTERFIQQDSAEPEEDENAIDPCMAAELTGYVGGEIQGEINLVLRVVARVDPDRVARLLR
jgi:hypothetical protein